MSKSGKSMGGREAPDAESAGRRKICMIPALFSKGKIAVHCVFSQIVVQ